MDQPTALTQTSKKNEGQKPNLYLSEVMTIIIYLSSELISRN